VQLFNYRYFRVHLHWENTDPIREDPSGLYAK
jgi:hypothetical protein